MHFDLKKDLFMEKLSPLVDFFERPVLLNSETTQIFGNRKLNNCNNSQNEDDNESEKHVKYTEPINDIAAIFQKTEKYYPTEHFQMSIPKESNQTFFIPVKFHNGHFGYLIRTSLFYAIYDCDSSTFNYFDVDVYKQEKNMVITHKSIAFSSKGPTFTFKAPPDSQISQLKSKDIEPIFYDFLTKIYIQKQVFESYQLFYLSIAKSTSFPPVNIQTLPFYKSLFTDYFFLYLYQRIAYDREQNLVLIPAFKNLAGTKFPDLYKFMAWSDFHGLGSPNLVMRGNNFFVSTTTYYINRDESFKKFVDSVSLKSDTLIQDFLREFERLELGPLPRYLLHTIYVEGQRFFPHQNAARFAVSGVLFLRLFSSQLLARETEYANNIKPIVPIYNLSDKQHPEEVKQVEKLIDRYKPFPDDYYEENRPNNSIIEDITALLNFVVSHTNDFIGEFNGKDYVKLIEEFNARGDVVFDEDEQITHSNEEHDTNSKPNTESQKQIHDELKATESTSNERQNDGNKKSELNKDHNENEGNDTQVTPSPKKRRKRKVPNTQSPVHVEDQVAASDKGISDVPQTPPPIVSQHSGRKRIRKRKEIVPSPPKPTNE